MTDQRNDWHNLNVAIPNEMDERMDEKVDQGEWESRSDYVRSMIRAGESNVADLDPRTNTSSKSNHSIDDMLLDGLTNEFQDIDDCLDSALNSLATRLKEIEEDDQYPVEHHPRKGYRLTE